MTNHLKECIKSIEEIESAAKRYKEIKRMAWEMFLHTPPNIQPSFVRNWEAAEEFYEFAKAKEQEKENDKTKRK